jgi:hypothetical protein
VAMSECRSASPERRHYLPALGSLLPVFRWGAAGEPPSAVELVTSNPTPLGGLYHLPYPVLLGYLQLGGVLDGTILALG